MINANMRNQKSNLGRAGQAVARLLGNEFPVDPKDVFLPSVLGDDGCFPVGTTQMCSDMNGGQMCFS